MIPKRIRDRLGLHGNEQVEITERGGRVEIEPAPTDVELVREGSVLVARPLRSPDRARGRGNLFGPDAPAATASCCPGVVHAHLTGVTGGASYGALVGLTAEAAGATLLTRDLRAVESYQRLRVEFDVPS